MGAVTEIFEEKQIKKTINPNFLEEHSDMESMFYCCVISL